MDENKIHIAYLAGSLAALNGMLSSMEMMSKISPNKDGSIDIEALKAGVFNAMDDIECEISEIPNGESLMKYIEDMFDELHSKYERNQPSSEVNIFENVMAKFLICDVVAQDTKCFEHLVKSGENGAYKLEIKINGMPVNADPFLKELNYEFNESVKAQAATLFSLEFDKMIESIHNIQESLENYDKIFENLASDESAN